MSHRRSTIKDRGGFEETGAYTNNAFVKEELFPAVGNSSEREIEKYRRSTIKKSISANRCAIKSKEDDQVVESQNGRSSSQNGKRPPYHRHCAKRKFRQSDNQRQGNKNKETIKKKMAREDYSNDKTDHRMQRTFSISSESNSSTTEVQGIDHHDNFSPWHSSCSIWLQQMLTAAIEELINSKETSVIKWCKSFFDDSANEFTWDNMPTECQDVGVLIAALQGNVAMMSCFLEFGGDANATDLLDRTALHYAASSFRPDATQCIELLIKHGANIEVWDRYKEATPLICASASGRIELVEVFINAGADVNAGQSDSTNLDCCSPLVWAVRARSTVCATRLIRAGASVNSLQVYSESPIHVAADQGDVRCLKLLLDNNADLRVVFGKERRNALHLASVQGNVECIRMLLQSSKAQVNTKDSFGRTPLHLAALSQSFESVEELLKNGAEIDNCDEMKETPLHVAVMSRQSTEVVKLLISKGANVNAKDQYEQTPLHIAAFNENSKIAALLIHSGADLSAKNCSKISALASVIRRVPDTLTAISHKLDSAIEIVDNEPTEPDCELKLDFKVLVPGGNQQNDGEMSFLTALVAADQQQILQHPLIVAFLHLKWMAIRTTFIVSLIFQLLYVLSLTFSLYHGYVVKENLNETNGTNAKNTTNATLTNATMEMSNSQAFTEWPWPVEITLWWMTVFMGAATGIKEMFQFYCNAHEYVRDIENYFQIISILAMVITLSFSPQKEDWRHHIAALLIIVAWFNLMLHVGRFPVFGLYVQMFNTVARNIGKLLVAYMSLIIGFSLGFAILFPKTGYFSQMPGALLTAIVMMTGEMEYKNIFYENKTNESPNDIKYIATTHLIFLFFVLFIVIVLMNLLVGLAVSDIQGLQKSAGLNRLVRLTKQIARMESFIFFPWRINFPCLDNFQKSRRKFIQQNVLVVNPRRRINHNFRPNDPRDDRFPPEIKESLLKIVVIRVANRKKGSQKIMAHVPIIRTATGQNFDTNNSELFTEVINRVDDLFANYMSQIVTINTNIEEHLEELATTRSNWQSTRFTQPRHSCGCSMINEQSLSIHVDSVNC